MRTSTAISHIQQVKHRIQKYFGKTRFECLRQKQIYAANFTGKKEGKILIKFNFCKNCDWCTTIERYYPIMFIVWVIETKSVTTQSCRMV